MIWGKKRNPSFLRAVSEIGSGSEIGSASWIFGDPEDIGLAS